MNFVVYNHPLIVCQLYPWMGWAASVCFFFQVLLLVEDSWCHRKMLKTGQKDWFCEEPPVTRLVKGTKELMKMFAFVFFLKNSEWILNNIREPEKILLIHPRNMMKLCCLQDKMCQQSFERLNPLKKLFRSGWLLESIWVQSTIEDSSLTL